MAHRRVYVSGITARDTAAATGASVEGQPENKTSLIFFRAA